MGSCGDIFVSVKAPMGVKERWKCEKVRVRGNLAYLVRSTGVDFGTFFLIEPVWDLDAFKDAVSIGMLII